MLEPSTKMAYFVKYWPSELVSQVEDAVQARVSNYLFIVALNSFTSF